MIMNGMLFCNCWLIKLVNLLIAILSLRVVEMIWGRLFIMVLTVMVLCGRRGSVVNMVMMLIILCSKMMMSVGGRLWLRWWGN